MSGSSYSRWCPNGCGKSLYFRKTGIYATRLYCDRCGRSFVKKRFLKNK